MIIDFDDISRTIHERSLIWLMRSQIKQNLVMLNNNQSTVLIWGSLSHKLSNDNDWRQRIYER